ncbi:unnamed protein product [Ilex paraguariensis]|uniref:Uncharacterized protein n=1 Tax=Ilex paraguariensis TaxID=185542 RepID=A0ABC8S2T8_9AQUA
MVRILIEISHVVSNVACDASANCSLIMVSKFTPEGLISFEDDDLLGQIPFWRYGQKVNRSRSSDDIDLASHCLPKACREEVLAVERDPSTTLNRSSIDENDLDLLDVSSNQEKLNEGENKEENILDAFIRSSKIPKFNHVAFIRMPRTQEYLERDTFRAQEGLRFVPFAMKLDLKRDEDDEAFKTMKHSNDEPFCDEASGAKSPALCCAHHLFDETRKDNRSRNLRVSNSFLYILIHGPVVTSHTLKAFLWGTEWCSTVVNPCVQKAALFIFRRLAVSFIEPLPILSLFAGVISCSAIALSVRVSAKSPALCCAHHLFDQTRKDNRSRNLRVSNSFFYILIHGPVVTSNTPKAFLWGTEWCSTVVNPW